MESIKNFAKYLIDNGLAFEINRKILHPLGLTLVVDVDKKNKKQLIISSLMKTEDLEGFLYDDETLDENKKKYNEFVKSNEVQQRFEARKNKHGFIEQK